MRRNRLRSRRDLPTSPARHGMAACDRRERRLAARPAEIARMRASGQKRAVRSPRTEWRDHARNLGEVRPGAGLEAELQMRNTVEQTSRIRMPRPGCDAIGAAGFNAT